MPPTTRAGHLSAGTEPYDALVAAVRGEMLIPTQLGLVPLAADAPRPYKLFPRPRQPGVRTSSPCSAMHGLDARVAENSTAGYRRSRSHAVSLPDPGSCARKLENLGRRGSRTGASDCKRRRPKASSFN